jgi:hypothetical protein
VPLIVVPLVSLMTRTRTATSTDDSRKTDFYAMLSGEKKVDHELA